MVFAAIAAVFVFAEWRVDDHTPRRDRLFMLGIATVNIACGALMGAQGGA